MTPTLSEVTRDLLRSYNRFPRKKLGQHFLVDPGVLERIVEAAKLSADDTVVEIGPGLGAVTSELAKRAGHVIAIDIDKELIGICRKVLAEHKNIEFKEGDILDVDYDKLIKEDRYKVVGNLPYYITAPIIEGIIEAKKKPELAVLMVQKEVAERMAAVPGSKKYGSFSIFVQFYAEVELNSFVSKSSFYPWPEVGSAVVVLRPHKTPKYAVKDEKLFFDMMHAAFQQRRKKLRNSLEKFGLKDPPIDLNRRPEQLSIEEFAILANVIK